MKAYGLHTNTLFFGLLFICSAAVNASFAQTVIISESFENWFGTTPDCAVGWTCGTSPGCTSGSSCFWGSTNTFGASGRPNTQACDAALYARANTTGLAVGDTARMVSLSVNLSSFAPTDDIELNFCYINPELAPGDQDGLIISFSSDGGSSWVPQLSISMAYDSWTNMSLSIPAAFRTSSFKVKLEGISGAVNTVDLGIDKMEIVHNTPVCQGELTNISTTGPAQICKDNQEDWITFSHDGTSGQDYVYIVTDPLDIIYEVHPTQVIDFNEYGPDEYNIYGFSYTGTLNASVGQSVHQASSSACFALSNNSLSVLVVEVSVSALPSANYNGYDISRFGGSDGALIASPAGGSGDYAYEWNTTPPVTGPQLNNLAAGTYIVELTDNLYGCEASSTYTMTQPQLLQANLQAPGTFSGSPISCYGQSDGVLAASVSGGVPPYSFSWVHDPGLADSLLSDIGAGTYVVSITDANGVVSEDTLDVSGPEPLEATIVDFQQVCDGGSGGSVELSASGGTGSYSFQWAHGPTAATVSGLSAGNYSCLITDANQCRDTISISLGASAAIQMEFVTESADCSGTGSGSILTSVSGGNPPFTYNWTHGPQTADLFDLQAGTYTLTVVDSIGCEATETVQIGGSPNWQVNLTTTPDNGTGIGTASVEVNGALPPYKYAWQGFEQVNTATISGLFVGSYSLEITDSLGCVYVETFEIEPKDEFDCAEIYMGFSPNGDGINDQWYIPCIPFFPENELIIYNRWGQELYAIQNYDNSWNGTINGRPLPDGTYFYTILIRHDKGERLYKGTVSIIR